MKSGPHVLTTSDHNRWMKVVGQATQHDFYHLPTYHALVEQHKDVEALLFVWVEGVYFVAVPLLLRPMKAVPCLVQTGAQWWDATSVYGYAGPIASHPRIPEPVLRNFRAALREALMEQRIVTVFSRLHPLLSQSALLSGLGETVEVGQTVSIDLALPVEQQHAQYRKDYKRQINKLRRLGATCFQDSASRFLGEFIDIYYENMRRVGAADAYFFDRAYFEDLLSSPELGANLFICRLEEEVICGALFCLCDGIIQAHLGATRTDYLRLSPMKLLFDTVRLWANENGARALHLGGGVGNRCDSLFQFKAGFSKTRHAFSVWRWVLLPEINAHLVREKERWCEHRGMNGVFPEHFPAYRCPDCPQFHSTTGLSAVACG